MQIYLQVYTKKIKVTISATFIQNNFNMENLKYLKEFWQFIYIFKIKQTNFVVCIVFPFAYIG